MYKIALLFISFFSLINVHSSEVPLEDFFQFFSDGQNNLQAPASDEKYCVTGELSTLATFNAKTCVEKLCAKPEDFIEDLFKEATTNEIELHAKCALEDGADNGVQACKVERFNKYNDQIKQISNSLEKFMKTELILTGQNIRAGIDFINNPDNPNSPFDNFGSNIGDLWVFIIDKGDLFNVDETEDGINLSFKSERKIRKELKKSFELSRRDEKAAVEVIKALLANSNLIFAAEMLGPDYVMKKVLTQRGLQMEPEEAMKKIKADAVKKIKATLGDESIDPEYQSPENGGIVSDRETLIIESLILDSLASSLSPSVLKRMSKSEFAKPTFYNREKFDRDWTDPFAEKYNSTLKYLEGLTQIYDGKTETVSKADLYPFITDMLRAIELLPDDKELKEVKDKVPGFFDSYFGNIAKEFSAQSTEEIKKEVTDIHIHYPKTKKEYLNYIQSWLKYRQALSNNTAKQLSDPTNKKAKAYFGRLYLQSLLLGESEEGGVSELGPLVSINAVPDFYIGSYNGIKIGPYAVEKFDTDGKQILGHELGHHIGHFMEDHPLSNKSTDRFEKVRECLSSAHPDKKDISKKVKATGKKTYKWKEDMYTEEDFSDWISSKGSSGNFACYFLQDINLDRPMEELLINQDKKDPHSSAFYRLLNIELNQKGSLPLSCRTEFVKKCP